MTPSDHARLSALVRQAAQAAGVPADVLDAAAITLERPRQAGHGDLSCNLAMQLARPLKQAPPAMAERLVAALVQTDLAAAEPMVERSEVAGPGFINLWLKPAIKQGVVRAILQRGALPEATPRGRVMLEFVSANPTGPLHVGHGRQAALGDVLASIMSVRGWTVAREFYYNDAGAQIDNLALSVQARIRGIGPEDEQRFPKDGYRGDYISDIARAYLAGETAESERVAPVKGRGADDATGDDLDAIRRFAVACLRREQDLDLAAFGVRFDHYSLESSLYSDGLVDKVVQALVDKGHTFESDGALWLRTTDYGDDKDRVMRKSEGGYTYFVPDVAYHTTKWSRGFAKAINIQGSDHHGTIARVRAGLQALDAGIPQGYPDYLLHKMVRVMRGGSEVKISKRAGSYVTLRDLIEWSGESAHEGDAAHERNGANEGSARNEGSGTNESSGTKESSGTNEAGANAGSRRGRDAVRFFLASRKGDSEFTFDVDLARSRSDENPVYYVQYAHARICSILALSQSPDGTQEKAPPARDAIQAAAAQLRDVPLAPLDQPADFALIAKLAAFDEALAQAEAELAPHHLPHYLKELAAAFHTYYNAQRVLVDDPALRAARLALLLATRSVLATGLEIMGVSAPERM